MERHPVREIPIHVYYPPGDERVSHFRPIRDFLRITLLNFMLLISGPGMVPTKEYVPQIQKQAPETDN